MLKIVRQSSKQSGLSVTELVLVVAIILIVAGIALPSMTQAWLDIKLRSSASQVADLMQRARMQAAKDNAIYPLRYQVNNGTQQVYIDLNNNGALDFPPEPYIDLPGSVTLAAAAPNGAAGQPTPYVLAGDSSVGAVNTNGNTLAFSSRGLPCNYDAPPTCTTPSANYFVYYFQDARPNGWSAVVVTKAGRSKTVLWNGASWN
jgi:Tfp pilus assembly protein FimT